jgi:hypothetical protein
VSRGGLAVLLAAGLTNAACITAELVQVGPMRAAHEDDCPVQVFTGTPPYAVLDLASAKATCSANDRPWCAEQLGILACRSGGDTIYGVTEAPYGMNYQMAGMLALHADAAAPGAAPVSPPVVPGPDTPIPVAPPASPTPAAPAPPPAAPPLPAPSPPAPPSP